MLDEGERYEGVYAIYS